MEEINFIFRWGHLLFGITWIGMLYYFNFVQGGYFKEASAEGLADAKAKLAPSALWWFRWGAMFTFLTGLYLLHTISGTLGVNEFIIVGAALGTFMFLNVWVIIWPAQQIALGMKEGDGPAAGAKALLASRTNTLFSGPMAYFMLASAHKGAQYSAEGLSTGLWAALAVVILLEVNAIAGKQGPMASVKGVIHSSIALTVVLALILHYV
ncbi:MAG: antitermination protein NusG [Gammaproteobacteria bacterium]|nr:antitermination protein NusG [Gammaproteobacteria bacterium]